MDEGEDGEGAMGVVAWAGGSLVDVWADGKIVPVWEGFVIGVSMLDVAAVDAWWSIAEEVASAAADINGVVL